MASKSEHAAEVVKLLLDAGADPNLAEKDEQTTLFLASYCGHAKVTKLEKSQMIIHFFFFFSFFFMESS